MTMPMSAQVARKALRKMDEQSRATMLKVIARWLEELERAEGEEGYARKRKAALDVRATLRLVAGWAPQGRKRA
jgi:hypothetical protein